MDDETGDSSTWNCCVMHHFDDMSPEGMDNSEEYAAYDWRACHCDDHRIWCLIPERIRAVPGPFRHFLYQVLWEVWDLSTFHTSSSFGRVQRAAHPRDFVAMAWRGVKEDWENADACYWLKEWEAVPENRASLAKFLMLVEMTVDKFFSLDKERRELLALTDQLKDCSMEDVT
jgi:hypothetical protein